MTDVIRGVNKIVQSSTNSAEITDPSSGYLSSFDSDGFSVQAGSSSTANFNTNSENYVSWNWKANGAGSANTVGDIDSTVSVNTTSGFSIVKWTSNGSNDDTIGHGLGVTPKLVFYKRLDSTGTWYVVYTFVDGSQDYLVLDTNASVSSLDPATYGTATATTLSNIGLGNTQEYLAYCFAEVPGYSKFSSYYGNGDADGPVITTGFKPSFLMIKKSSASGDWYMFDNKITPTNVVNSYQNANKAEADHDSASYYIDILSNGFKIRGSGSELNNGETFMYMAFGQTLVGTNNVPVTAR